MRGGGESVQLNKRVGEFKAKRPERGRGEKTSDAAKDQPTHAKKSLVQPRRWGTKRL